MRGTQEEMMAFVKGNVKRILVLGVLSLALGMGFAQCKKDDKDNKGLLLLGLLAGNAAAAAAACSPTSSSGFVVILPCGVAQ